MLKPQKVYISMLLIIIGICAGIFSEALAATPAKPSVVRIQGRQLMLEKVLADGSLDKARAYLMKGVNWFPATIPPEKGPDPAQPSRIIRYGFFFNQPGTKTKGEDVLNYWSRNEYGKHYATDMPLIQKMNANTVRLYSFGNNPDIYKAVLDKFYDDGIMVIMIVANSKKEMKNKIYMKSVVKRCKDHPAILMWSLEMPWEIKGKKYSGCDNAADAAKSMNDAAKFIKSLDPNHPVDGHVVGFLFCGEGPGMGEEIVAKCDNVDVFGIDAYSEDCTKKVLEKWKDITPKPMYFNSLGTDSFRTTDYKLKDDYQVVMCKGAEDQKMQADYIIHLWNILKENLSAVKAENICVGGVLIDFNDALWKSGCYHIELGGAINYKDLRYEDSYKKYNTEGIYGKGSGPDDVVNMEYTGVVDAERKPKAAYFEVQRYYKELDDLSAHK